MLKLSFVSVNAPKVKRAKTRTKKKNLRVEFYKLARWLHVYISTASLLLILFFAITGITLNHPDWVFGNTPIEQELTGTLPTNWQVNAEPNWLQVTEYLRSQKLVHGQLGDYRNDEIEAEMNFTAAGYAADVVIDMKTGSYTVYSDSQGFVAVMNDLHKGRYTGKIWNLAIDISAIFLVVVSITGLALLLLLKKIRLKGSVVIAVASLLALALMIYTSLS